MRTWTQTLLLALLAFSAAPAHSVDFTERLIDTSTSTKSEAWSASGSITSSGHLDAVSVSNVESPVEGDLVQLASGEIVTSIDAVRCSEMGDDESCELMWIGTDAESIDRHQQPHTAPQRAL